MKIKIVISLVAVISLCVAGFITYSVYYTSEQLLNIITIKTHQANPQDKDFYETAFQFDKKQIDLSSQDVVAGIIPHHLLAADLIAEFFYNLEDKNYDAIILIGPNHYNVGDTGIITSAYDWQTPYGILSKDLGLFNTISQFLDVSIDENVIANEHAIYSEVAFIKRTFPESTFIPLILKANVTVQEADNLAQELYALSNNKKILVLASVDFSHYKSSDIAQIHDQVSIEVIKNNKFDEVYNLDIDSPPSIYTILKFNELIGGSFQLLNNSNSALLVGDETIDSTTSYVTGYFYKTK